MHKINQNDIDYKKALKKVFALHVAMFFITLVAVIIGRSSSVLADAFDFFGDAVNYALGIYIINSTIMFRAGIAIGKAVVMLGYGFPVMLHAIINFREGYIPDHDIMIGAAIAGILVHLYCMRVLYRFRSGDSNRLSIWVCTINDLLSNVITLIASQLVMFTDSIIPDIVAASIIVSIAIVGAIVILKQAIFEIRIYKAEKRYA